MSYKMNIVDKLHQEFVIKKIKDTDWKKGTKGPLVVEFDTTEVCNFACPGCISEDLVSNKTSFSRERLLQLAKEMYAMEVKAVILIGGGEPLAHPAVGEFIEYLGNRDIHIGITTNGVFIDKYLEVIAKFAKWTRISMDAATESTFNLLRPSKNGKSEFHHIIENMKQLSKIKKGELGFSYLIRTEADGFGIKSNINEIYQAAELARDIGCDYFEVKPSYSYINGQDHALVVHTAERMEEAKKEIGRLEELETSIFRIVKAINLDDSLNRVQIKQKKEYITCPMAELRTLVTPSGVYVCPYWRGKDRFRIGDAQNLSLREIWDGECRKKVMKTLIPSKVCQFHCLRHESIEEVLRICKEGTNSITTIQEYDRFI